MCGEGQTGGKTNYLDAGKWTMSDRRARTEQFTSDEGMDGDFRQRVGGPVRDGDVRGASTEVGGNL